MQSLTDDEIAIQRSYYAKTAANYDSLHADEVGEHDFALAVLIGLFDHLEIRSVLDIGSGTGRALLEIKRLRPDIKIVGIEPVAELRQIGHLKGLGTEELVEGDGLNLRQSDRSFDLVCEFGILHHVKRPEKVVAEMLRVAERAIFISDSNNFGQGSAISRFIKLLIDAVGLWRLFDLLKTRGKGYAISEGDGLFYSYSVFNNYRQIKSTGARIHLLNTTSAGINPYRTASHIALLAVKH